MKNFSRRLKKTAPLILLGLILDHTPVHQSAQALVGGPFDDNQYPGATVDGTYSGTMTGHNLIGIVSFGVSTSQEAGGRFSVFHEGFVHYGAATGMVDLQSRIVAGSLLGVAPLGGAGFPQQVSVLTSSTQTPALISTTSTITTVTPPGVTETQGGSGTVANAVGGALTVRSAAEGAFEARMHDYPQAIKFEGSGRLSTNANTAVVSTPTTSLNATNNGALANQAPAYTVIFGSNGSPQIQTDTSPDGSKDENIAASGGNLSKDLFSQRAILRDETPFKIRGSRTSRSVYQATFNYTATAPITLVASTPVPGAPAATPAATPVPNP